MKYISLVVVAIIFCLPFYLAVSSWLTWTWFVAGVAIGLAIMIADELFLYRFYADKTPKAMQLITRSPLFIFAYPVLAVFAITSTSQVLGIGVILGLGLTLVVEGFQFRTRPAEFHQRFLQHLPAAVDQSTINALLVIEVAIFAVLSVYAWIRV